MAKHRFLIEGKEFNVDVGARSGGRVRVSVNGKAYDVTVQTPDAAASGRSSAAPSLPPPAPVTPAAPAQGANDGEDGEIRAPISGHVVSIAVSEGEAVSVGTVLLVLEAMKMQNEIVAPIDGTVERVAVSAEQDVSEGVLLVVISPSA